MEAALQPLGIAACPGWPASPVGAQNRLPLVPSLLNASSHSRRAAAQEVEAAVQPLGLPFDWCLPHAHRSMSKVASQPSGGRLSAKAWTQMVSQGGMSRQAYPASAPGLGLRLCYSKRALSSLDPVQGGQPAQREPSVCQGLDADGLSGRHEQVWSTRPCCRPCFSKAGVARTLQHVQGGQPARWGSPGSGLGGIHCSSLAECWI